MRTLIIGGSGFLGSRLALCMGRHCQSTFFNNRLSGDQIPLDLSDEKSIKRCLKRVNPELIIHCGGLTGTVYCEQNKTYATKVNVRGTKIILDKFGGKVIYFSSDYVFDGEAAPYDEKSQTNPLNHYGRTKLEAEKEVLRKDGNLVLRLSGLYGINRRNNRFIQRLMSKRIGASMELVSTPTYVEDLVNSLPQLIEMEGTVHFSGEESFSRYDFLQRAIKGLGLNTELYKIDRGVNVIKRPKDSSLKSLFSLKKTSVNDALTQMKIQL